MNVFTAITVLELFLALFFSSSLDATTPIGFSVPLIPLTSPKHPLYNPRATREDIIAHKLRISANRQVYFAHMRQSSQNDYRPVESLTVVAYSIGSPPVEAIGFFDTGSSLIWLQCQPCKKCYNQIRPIFDPTRSLTYKRVECHTPVCSERRLFSCNYTSNTCNFGIRYADGSSSYGDVSMDTLSFPENEYSQNRNLPNTLFGCGFNNFDKFSSGYGGIVGLQNTSISLIGQTKIDSFSYCKNEDGGYIRFGSLSTLVGVRTTLFTSAYRDYQVILLDIAVDNTKLNIPSDVFKIVENEVNSGVIIDSGTAYTYLHPVAMAAVITKIRDIAGYVPYQILDWLLCYSVNENEGLTLEKLPSVQFILDQNTTISLPNENVWTEKDTGGYICLKIRRSSNTMTTLGSEQLANYNVGYDLKGNALWLDYQLGCEF